MQRQVRAVIRQKILDSQAAVLPTLTRRDTWIPLVKNKAVAVVGMRRSGKSSLLWQLLAERVQAGKTRDELLYFSFEDERLAGMGVNDLGLVLEEFFNLHPGLRDKKHCTFFFDEMEAAREWPQAHKVLIAAAHPDMRMIPQDVEVLHASNWLLTDVVNGTKA